MDKLDITHGCFDSDSGLQACADRMSLHDLQ